MSRTWNVAAPDGELHLIVELDATGGLAYSVRADGTSLIASSRLGVDLRPGGLLQDGLKVIQATEEHHDSTFSILAGKSAQAHDCCNELTLELQETAGHQRRIVWTFRIYSDAVAFRYTIPEQPTLKDFELVAERTEFRFAANHRCWAMDLPHFQSSFESEFHPRKLGDLRPGQLISCPLTVHADAGHGIAITEAALHDFAGMYLEAFPGHANTLISRLAPRMDGTYASVRAAAPHSSPWRVIQIAPNPAKLIESNILYCLNAPCALPDTSWIKPGKVTWDWWAGHAPSGRVQKPGMNNETMMDYIDFAAEMKLQYMLIDGGWYAHGNPLCARPEIDLPLLIGYARVRGVDTMVWNHQKDLINCLDKAFAWYHSLGIKGVKVDFFDRDDQQMVQWARDVVLTGANHRLLIDLHGIFKPTGFERTYPNLMTHEGIMGAEYNKWSTRITPEHNVTIPFTRMLAGPMDYTPGGFNNATKDQFRPRSTAPMVMGTRCHNLAMYVVYQSALQMISDFPDAIRNQRGSQFLKVVPSAWDQTIAIAGEVGEYIAIARRKGADWFLGVMTNSQARTLPIRLGFLGEGVYHASIFSDGPNAASDPTSVVMHELKATSTGQLTVNLAPAGGVAVHFRRV